MIAKIKAFFKPETELQQLRRIVIILSAAIAVCVVSMLLYGLKRPSAADYDRIGMMILLDQASR